MYVKMNNNNNNKKTRQLEIKQQWIFRGCPCKSDTRSSHQLVGPSSAVTSVAENLDTNFKCVDFPQDSNTVGERSSGRKNIAEGQTIRKKMPSICMTH